jgi:hypothetical protein
VGVSGIYSKLGKGNTKGSMVRPRWKLEAERACFCSSDAFKAYDNLSMIGEGRAQFPAG